MSMSLPTSFRFILLIWMRSLSIPIYSWSRLVWFLWIFLWCFLIVKLKVFNISSLSNFLHWNLNHSLGLVWNHDIWLYIDSWRFLKNSGRGIRIFMYVLSFLPLMINLCIRYEISLWRLRFLHDRENQLGHLSVLITSNLLFNGYWSHLTWFKISGLTMFSWIKLFLCHSHIGWCCARNFASSCISVSYCLKNILCSDSYRFLPCKLSLSLYLTI